MVRRIAGCFVLVVLASTPTATAADPITAGAAIAVERNIDQADGIRALPFEVPEAGRRGSVLPSLYVGLAGLNAYDAYTTLKGVARGAAESNRVVGRAAGTPATMWVLKGGVTAGSILASERLWRSGRRAQAIGMMVASNILMTIVGAHNSRVVSRQR